MVCTGFENVAENSSAIKYAVALRAARLAEVAARATWEKIACAAVAHTKGILHDAGFLDTATGKKRKSVSLFKGYSLRLEWIDEAGNPSYELYKDQCCLANEWETFDLENKVDEFIADLAAGFIEEVATFVASVANVSGKRCRRKIVFKKATDTLIDTYGVMIPARPGWDHAAAKRLDDGTLILPRERTLCCPTAKETKPFDGWISPYSFLSWSPCDAREPVAEVRLAMVIKGSDTWFAFLAGDTLLPKVIEACDCCGAGDDDKGSLKDCIYWAMDTADLLELEIETAWAERRAREKLSYGIVCGEQPAKK